MFSPAARREAYETNFDRLSKAWIIKEIGYGSRVLWIRWSGAGRHLYIRYLILPIHRRANKGAPEQ